MANISTYPIGTPGAGDLIPGTQLFTDENGKTHNLTKNFTVTSIAGFSSATAAYTTYVARFSQTGITAPQAGILQNTTGKTFTWSRTGVGDYLITTDTAFDMAKVWINASTVGDHTTNPASTGVAVLSCAIGSTTTIKVRQLDAADKSRVDVIEGGNIEIRIYS